MDVPPVAPTPDDLDTLSRGELVALVRAQAVTIAALLKRVEALEEQVRTHSRNSSKPPSTDPPAVAKKKKRGSGRAPGGQPGHRGHHRALRPTAEVDTVVAHDPLQCGRCHGHRLTRTTAPPGRKQVSEIPRLAPHITEHQLYEGVCADGGACTPATLPADVPRGDFGPRAVAIGAYLTGVLHNGRRGAQDALLDLFGLEMSLGTVSANEGVVTAALGAPYAAAHDAAAAAPLAHVDETGWRQARGKAWLWVMVTAVATVFLVHARRSHAAASVLLRQFAGVLVTDRWAVYDRWAVWMRQLCWAHLLRDFTKIAERKGSGVLGRALLAETQTLFAAWHRVRDGTLTRADFFVAMAPLRVRVEDLLHAGTRSRAARTRGMCREILKLAPALWTFIDIPGVEPTNNTAERAIRNGVIWRKICFGSHSEAGGWFVERMLTVRATLRQQGRSVLDYLVKAVEAYTQNKPAPALILAPQTTDHHALSP